MGPRLGRQTERAEAAAAHGWTRPPGLARIEHLQIDEGLAGLAVREGRKVHNLVRNAVSLLHRPHMRHDSGIRHTTPGCAFGEVAGPEGIIRYVSVRLKVRGSEGRTALHVDAPWLEIAMDPLPNTVLTALVGRTVDALAVVHPDFDRRVIRRAENMRGEKRPTVRIGVDQHLVPMPA